MTFSDLQGISLIASKSVQMRFYSAAAVDNS